MGYHGWRGDPPRTEDLARERIIAAATRCVERMGAAKTTLSDVADEVGVTRQTVYRYFPSLAELLSAVAETGAAHFIARMRNHLGAAPTPLDAVVEAFVFTLHEIPGDPRIGLLLEADDQGLFGRGVTTTTALDLGARLLRELDVDWASAGVGDDDFYGLAEVMMRLMVSFLQHPPAAPRTADELRAFIRRWLGPIVATVR